MICAKDVALDTELCAQRDEAFAEMERTKAAHTAATAALAELQPAPPTTTESEPLAAATTTCAPAAAAADSPAADSPVALRTPNALATATSPATEATTGAVMATAVEQSLAAARVRNFRSRLDAMEPGDCMKLQPLARDGDTAAKPASLMATEGKTYLLVHCEDAGRTQEIVTLDEADEVLAKRFDLPAAPKGELSFSDAAALRAREKRQAAAERDEAKRAAVEAATLDWCALYLLYLTARTCERRRLEQDATPPRPRGGAHSSLEQSMALSSFR